MIRKDLSFANDKPDFISSATHLLIISYLTTVVEVKVRNKGKEKKGKRKN
ncbi:hypothetical protein [Wukongibacter baidiensis]